MPSVVYVGADGSVLVGEAAERRVLSEPERVARQFKRRIGDPAPILLGGSPHSAELLTSKLLRWVVDAVASREGEMPTTITITHPANWGAYKKDLLEQAVHLAGLSGPGNPTIRLLSEPEAAAIHYASTERVEPGQAVAVYDLGGGTFDVAILRATGDSFAILGVPEGIERLGGIDFDAAVLGHVADARRPRRARPRRSRGGHGSRTPPRSMHRGEGGALHRHADHRARDAPGTSHRGAPHSDRARGDGSPRAR